MYVPLHVGSNVKREIDLKKTQLRWEQERELFLFLYLYMGPCIVNRI